MNNVREFNFFEKIVIKDPSILCCSWLIVQTAILAQYFDKGHDPAKNGRSSFQHWYGFWIFAPTYAFYFILMVYIVIEQAGAAKSISDVYNMITPLKDKKHTYARVASVIELDSLSTTTKTKSNATEQSATTKGSIEDEYIDGYRMGPGDYERESALNRSLIHKVLLTFPAIFLSSCKISFDRHDEYSWHAVLFWLYGYFGFFLAVAIQKGNFFMRSQREIDIQDDIIRANLKRARESAYNQMKEKFQRQYEETEVGINSEFQNPFNRPLDDDNNNNNNNNR